GNGGRAGGQQARGEGGRRAPPLGGYDAADHSLQLESVDAGDGVGHERIDEPRPIWTLGPLERGGDAILEAERAIGDASRVRPPDAARQSVRDARGGAADHERAGDPRRGAPDSVLGQQHPDRRDSAPECPAKAVVLRPPAADLPANAPEEPVDPWGLSHRILPRSA